MDTQTDFLHNNNSDDILLNGGQKVGDLENSYLLTELEGYTSRTISPNDSSLNTSQTLRTQGNYSASSSDQGRKRKHLLKSQALKDKEKEMRTKEGDSKSDFITYLELLCEFYKQLQRLDAGGRTL